MKLTFCVPGVAHAWSRTRIAFDPRTGRVRPVNTAALRDYEHQVASAAALAARAQGWRLVARDVPVALAIVCHLPIAKGTAKRKVEALVGAPAVPSRGDTSNFLKAIEDGIVKCQIVIPDDAQIYRTVTEKYWCRLEDARVEVEVEA